MIILLIACREMRILLIYSSSTLKLQSSREYVNSEKASIPVEVVVNTLHDILAGNKNGNLCLGRGSFDLS